MVAILEFKMATISKSTYMFLTAIVILPDIENMGSDTKTKTLRVSEAKIWEKVVIGGGHFEKWGIPIMHPNFFDGNMQIINQTGLLNKMIPLLGVEGGGGCHGGPHSPWTI